jgi:proline iminopeptidase
MPERDLFPPIEPYARGMLAVDPRHTLYWEQSGNPRGAPVIFLHGGPGAGVNRDHRRFFDPAHYRIILFEQRGTGRSTPLGELVDNTTRHLVADIETLRRHFGVERWVVFGGSWGSTLALSYAETHPERCRALILRGIFLCRAAEIAWWLYDMRKIFPEAWRAFVAPIPEAERGDLLAAYYRRLTHPDPSVHLPAARTWCRYESSCATLLPGADTGYAEREDPNAFAKARIEAHYFMHETRSEDDDLIANLDRIRAIPATIVQGRYDIICPIMNADELAAAWPEAEYHVVPDAGHSAMEPGIRTRLVAASERMKRFA